MTTTTMVEALGYFVAGVAGATCLGALVLVLSTARPDDRGVLDPPAFRAHLMVERAAPVWAFTALLMVVVQAAADAGVSVTRLLGEGLPAALGASETARAWVVVALSATALAIGARLTVRWEWHVPLVIPALLGVIAIPVTGNAGQGPNHDFATSSVIVFAVAIAVWAGVRIVTAFVPVDEAMCRRVTTAMVAAESVAIVYGVLLFGLRVGVSGLHGGYGLLAVFVIAVLGIAVLADAMTLRGKRTAPTVPTAVAAVGVLAVLALLAVRTSPRLLASQPTVWDVLLGYQLPGAPTPLRLLSFWRFDPLLGVLGLALAGSYTLGVVRLRRHDIRWPAGRTVAWLAGCAALVVATSSGVRSYGSAMFSVHMAEHMMLNMFAPVLLVLGAPVTLALRVLPSAAPGRPPGPREWIVRVVHSPITTMLSSPVIAFVLFVGSLYAVYFTPLFDTLVRYHWGHEFMAVHFLATGYLFYWGIIGVDPGPRRLPFIGRLAMLFAIMPFHAFFGVAMMTMTSVVGGDFYRGLSLPWVANLNDEQHLGGAIAWAAGEVPLVIVVIALVTQWAGQDRRASNRADRHADAGYDDDLAAYNNMLRELANQRTSR